MRKQITVIFCFLLIILNISSVLADFQVSDTTVSFIAQGEYNVTRQFDYAGTGHYKNGLSVQQVGIYYNADDIQKFDKFIWYNETSGNGGWEKVAGANQVTTHASGWIDINSTGHLIYSYGGYWSITPADIYYSVLPYVVDNWQKSIDNFITYSGGSIMSGIVTNNDSCVVSARNGANDNSGTGIQIKRFNTTNMAAGENLNQEIANGMSYLGHTLTTTYSHMTYDPRHNIIMLTFSYKYGSSPNIWGSEPFMMSYDCGKTWRDGNGTLYSLPVEYTSMDIPFDNVNLGIAGNSYGVQQAITPNGNRMHLAPGADTDTSNKYGWLYINNDSGWTKHNLTGVLSNERHSQDCGSTKDYSYIIYTEAETNDTIQMKVSDDDGETWSEAIEVYNLSEDETGDVSIAGITKITPKSFDDNKVRVFFSFNNWTYSSNDHFQSVGWLSFNITQRNNQPITYINNKINDSVLKSEYTCINWTKNSNTAVYRIQISNTTDFLNPFINLSNITVKNGHCLNTWLNTSVSASDMGYNYHENATECTLYLPYSLNITYKGKHYYKVDSLS